MGITGHEIGAVVRVVHNLPTAVPPPDTGPVGITSIVPGVIVQNEGYWPTIQAFCD